MVKPKRCGKCRQVKRGVRHTWSTRYTRNGTPYLAAIGLRCLACANVLRKAKPGRDT